MVHLASENHSAGLHFGIVSDVDSAASGHLAYESHRDRREVAAILANCLSFDVLQVQDLVDQLWGWIVRLTVSRPRRFGDLMKVTSKSAQWNHFSVQAACADHLGGRPRHHESGGL